MSFKLHQMLRTQVRKKKRIPLTKKLALCKFLTFAFLGFLFVQFFILPKTH